VSNSPATIESLGSGRPRSGEWRPVEPERLTRYDLLLAGISVILTVAWVVGLLSGVPV